MVVRDLSGRGSMVDATSGSDDTSLGSGAEQRSSGSPRTPGLTTEEILEIHADWLLRWWHPDYDMWAPYWVHLPGLIKETYKGAHAYRAPLAMWGTPAFHEGLKPMMLGADPQACSPAEHAQQEEDHDRYVSAFATAIDFVLSPLAPVWAAESLLAALEHTAEELERPDIASSFVELLVQQAAIFEEARAQWWRLVQTSPRFARAHAQALERLR